MSRNRNDRILVISDMHHPYSHPDTFRFLSALKKKYDFTRIICIGDEVDCHALSFHDSDPDLPSAGDELKLAIKELKPLYKLFPEMDVIDSNHGSMHYRKGKANGIPRKYLREYNDILDAPNGWRWHMDLTLTLPNGNKAYFHHGLAKQVKKVVQQRGLCVIQGHFHEDFEIVYLGNPESLLWGMTVACLIDKKSMAFAYNRTNLNRPILGCGGILDSHPKLFPMVLNKNGRWTGYVP
jgi:hypothetical protein